MVISKEDVEKRIKANTFDDFTQLKLTTDAYRIHLKHIFDPISVVAIGKIDPLPHQVEAFIKMMNMLRPQSGLEGRIRMLLADDVGLGKTIIIGLVMKELILRKKARRVLIVCPSGLQIQWQEEMNEKFHEEFTIIKGSFNDNPYRLENRAIISVDMARNEMKRDLLMQAQWDMVIFDEAHKLKPGSLRYNLALDLSKRTEHLILATATPHDGKIENFIALVKLVDEELETMESPGELRQYLDPLMIRRLKEEIVDFKGRKIFRKREHPQTINVNYSPEEKEFYDRVEHYVNQYYQKAEEAKKSTAVLALYILHRRVSSSIHAGYLSMKKRKMRLLEPYIDFEAQKELDYLHWLDENDEEKKEQAEDILLGVTASTGDDLRVELDELDKLIELGKRLLENEVDSKYAKLVELVQEIRQERPDDKMIIFTEFKDTLSFLERKLVEQEGFLVAKIQGGMTNEEKKQASKLFEKKSQILLGTEAAGEGLNLQFANIAINYELPWNPNRLEQRIGRVYRYGQKKRIFIYNFKTAFPIDDAVLRKIQEKMENIRAIFGDSAIDVIGSLISEKEMLEIFKAARTAGLGVDKVDELLLDKIEILKEIEQFFIKERFNLVNVKSMTRDVSRCINNFDIERFLLTYLEKTPNADWAPLKEGQFHLHIPNCEIQGSPNCTKIDRISYLASTLTCTFDVNKKATFIALGHPVLECALDDSLVKQPISTLPHSEKGILVTYILRFFNGLQREIYSEPIIIMKTENDCKLIDPLMIWEIGNNVIEGTVQPTPDEYLPFFSDITTNPNSIIENEISDIEDFVMQKNIKDLEIEHKLIFSEYDWKIKLQKSKLDSHAEKGQTYLISPIEERIRELTSEYKKLQLENLTAREISWDLCGPVGVSFLLPPDHQIRPGSSRWDDDEKIEMIKKEIELIAMDQAIEHEKDHKREPKDVSIETFRGYDIYSTSQDEIRHIEVKGVSQQNPIQISSNEWRTASQLQDEYYLYVTQHALTNPTLKIIRNPYEMIAGLVRKVAITDYKIILDTFPDEFDISALD